MAGDPNSRVLTMTTVASSTLLYGLPQKQLFYYDAACDLSRPRRSNRPARVKLRRAAEAKKTEIELKPCQNLADYQLKD